MSKYVPNTARDTYKNLFVHQLLDELFNLLLHQTPTSGGIMRAMHFGKVKSCITEVMIIPLDLL